MVIDDLLLRDGLVGTGSMGLIAFREGGGAILLAAVHGVASEVEVHDKVVGVAHGVNVSTPLHE